MQSALITGSNGFIGQHLSQELEKRKIKVVKFSRQNNKHIDRPQDFIDLPKVDYVFHLAAVSGYKDCNENTNQAYQINVLSTINVLEYCRRVGAKLIFPSTYVYDAPYEDYKKEVDPEKPTTHYAFTKWLGGKLCQFYAQVYNVDCVLARTANVYGLGQSDIYLLPLIAKQIKHNLPIQLAKPDIERSFIFIDDLVDAYIKLAKAATSPGDIFHVSSDRSTSVADLLTMIEKITGKKIKIEYSGQDRPHEININRMDTAKIKKTINWSPKVTLEAGLLKLKRSQYF